MALQDLVRDLIHHADERLLAGWYRAISISPPRVRRQLEQSGLRWLDPTSGRADMLELDRSARWVIDQSRFGATAIGGIAGLGGLASVPPEAMAQVVAVLRMAQRLAVVYGFDPDTDRGRMAISRALAAGFEIELPERGQVGLRVSDLPSVIAPRVLVPRTVGSEVLGQILRKSAYTLARRFGRLVPVVGGGMGAVSARRERTRVGNRMHAVFRQLAEIRAVGVIEEAVEVA